MKGDAGYARVIQGLNPDATVLLVTDPDGHEFVIAYDGISAGVPQCTASAAAKSLRSPNSRRPS